MKCRRFYHELFIVEDQSGLLYVGATYVIVKDRSKIRDGKLDLTDEMTTMLLMTTM